MTKTRQELVGEIKVGDTLAHRSDRFDVLGVGTVYFSLAKHGQGNGTGAYVFSKKSTVDDTQWILPRLVTKEEKVAIDFLKDRGFSVV